MEYGVNNYHCSVWFLIIWFLTKCNEISNDTIIDDCNCNKKYIKATRRPPAIMDFDSLLLSSELGPKSGRGFTKPFVDKLNWDFDRLVHIWLSKHLLCRFLTSVISATLANWWTFAAPDYCGGRRDSTSRTAFRRT